MGPSLVSPESSPARVSLQGLAGDPGLIATKAGTPRKYTMESESDAMYETSHVFLFSDIIIRTRVTEGPGGSRKLSKKRRSRANSQEPLHLNAVERIWLDGATALPLDKIALQSDTLHDYSQDADSPPVGNGKIKKRVDEELRGLLLSGQGARWVFMGATEVGGMWVDHDPQSPGQKLNLQWRVYAESESQRDEWLDAITAAVTERQQETVVQSTPRGKIRLKKLPSQRNLQ